MSEYYPPAGFYFSVQILGAGSVFSLLTDIDSSFQEVSGIQANFDVEEVTEGGENRFVHRLPRPAKYSNLVLQRGVVTSTSALGEWVSATVGSSLSLPILTQNLLVMLLNGSGSPSILWAFYNAYPIRWEVGPLSSQKNEVLTEKLEFSYNYFQRVNVESPVSLALALGQLANRAL